MTEFIKGKADPLVMFSPHPIFYPRVANDLLLVRATVSACCYSVQMRVYEWLQCAHGDGRHGWPVQLSWSCGSFPGSLPPELCWQKQDLQRKKPFSQHLNLHPKSSNCLHFLPIYHAGNGNVFWRGPHSSLTLRKAESPKHVGRGSC